MSSQLTATEALGRIPGWSGDAVVVEEALPGLTNRSYRLRRGNEYFVLRLDAPHTAAIPLDRNVERLVLERAAKAGIAPAVAFADPESGILVTRFLAGAAVAPGDFRDSHFLERLAGLLRAVHTLVPLGRPFDAAGAARTYLAGLSDNPQLKKMASRCARIIDQTPLPDTLCCCHNDVVAENLVASDRLSLIDWEYAADNDPLFDLATPVAYHELDAAVSDGLLSAYLGGVTPEDRDRLAAQRRLADALHWLWLAQRQVLSPAPRLARRLDRLKARIEGAGPED